MRTIFWKIGGKIECGPTQSKATHCWLVFTSVRRKKKWEKAELVLHCKTFSLLLVAFSCCLVSFVLFFVLFFQMHFQSIGQHCNTWIASLYFFQIVLFFSLFITKQFLIYQPHDLGWSNWLEKFSRYRFNLYTII